MRKFTSRWARMRGLAVLSGMLLAVSALAVTATAQVPRPIVPQVEQRTGVVYRQTPVIPRLPADPDRRNLPRLDEPVHRAKVDLEVLQDFFSRQEDFVVWKIHAH